MYTGVGERGPSEVRAISFTAPCESWVLETGLWLSRGILRVWHGCLRDTVRSGRFGRTDTGNHVVILRSAGAA